ncbi:imidazole glycerol phosphate synthase subunit HisH [Winogradskyella sp. PC-19]|uniref:imidazole glycerol phosphate synthase subunit HisH n=1 Tax=Winogradskyella sp. PC-19 TaxID=754417 RepID=UPI000B3C314E|nr:imidazole glycerol phosphate synthase subunit HisH [Winogradskyella sp. PC-19]ARV09688.1 imidazole glycerol phosphate synthase subunit HisH [Winogradskyella sp. PC-19]
MISIIDYGAGNLGSIENMIKRIGHKSQITNSIDLIENSEKLILPGVGSFDHGMSQLKNSGLIDVINKKVLEDKTPILGICLGMQLMTEFSEEGDHKGLGWFNAEVVKFKSEEKKMKIPHMGWNIVDIKKESKIITDVEEEKRYYFVHSYYVKSNAEEEVLTTTNYINTFASALEKNNIFGVQFHPEKSHKFGLEVLRNFVNL